MEPSTTVQRAAPSEARGTIGRVAAAMFIVIALVAVLTVVFLRGYNAMTAGDVAGRVSASATDPYVPDLNPDYQAPPPADRMPATAGELVVSLTFDDGFSSQMTASSMVDEHGFRGTFYINSGSIGKPGHLSLEQLRTIADTGHEIGGHSISHPNLPTLASAEIAREICLDRKTLSGWGFTVRNFAYPFASTDEVTRQAAMDCGYNTARGLGDVENRFGCLGCVIAEAIPPRTADLTAAPSNVTNEWTLDDLKDAVQKPQLTGGWVQLTFHHLCTTDCNRVAIQESVFEEFLSWLDERTANSNIVVRSVEQVIGGPVQPLVEEPAPTSEEGGPSLQNTSLERLVRSSAELPDNIKRRGRMPECWTPASTGDHQVKVSTVSPGHRGDTALVLEVDEYADGEAKVIQVQDLGTCAPPVTPGKTYELGAWYTSTAPTQFSLSYRLERGIWVYWTSSLPFPTTMEYTEASWTTPPIPKGVTAISFGLALQENGQLITDDYTLRDAISRTPE